MIRRKKRSRQFRTRIAAMVSGWSCEREQETIGCCLAQGGGTWSMGRSMGRKNRGLWQSSTFTLGFENASEKLNLWYCDNFAIEAVATFKNGILKLENMYNF